MLPIEIPPVYADVPALIATFRALALKWDAALLNADAPTANRHGERIVMMIGRLEAFEDGPAAIVALMADPERVVRYRAAVYAFMRRHAPETAERVLVDLLSVQDHIAASASVDMMRWQLGPYRPG